MKGKNYYIPNVLSIAGSDPSGGAGIQADLKSFSANKTFGMSVITALTAQNTMGVQDIHLVPEDFIESQINSIFQEGPISVHPGLIEILASHLLFLKIYEKEK